MTSPTERQARIIWLAATGLAVGVLVFLVALLVWGLGRALDILSPVLWPLAVAGVLAYLLDPVVDWFEKRGLSRARAIVAVFAFALVIVGSLFGSVVPQIVKETRDLANRVPYYAQNLGKKIDERLTNPPPWLQRFLRNETQPPPPSPRSDAEMQNYSPPGPANSGGTNAPALSGLVDKQTLEKAASGAAGFVRTAGLWLFGRVGTWFGVLTGLALIPVYAFYFLLEKERISSRWTRYLPVSDSKFKDELVFVIRSINEYLIAFFRGQVLVAICDGIMYAIGFLIIQLPYAILIGAAAIVLTIIPFLGAIIICVVSLIIAIVTFGDWLHPLLVLVVFGIAQTLEGLVISPRIMGGRVGLHPLTIIIAVMAGTTVLGGLLGGILAIPLTAAMRVLMFRYIWKRPGETQGRLGS
jgi:predicted PurR-regulated permease PerM